jgi:hypothetical protein
MKSRWFWVILIVIIVFCLCLSCLGIGIGSYLLISKSSTSITETLDVPPFVIEPSESDPSVDPHFEENSPPEMPGENPEPSVVNPASSGAIETLDTLSNTIVPNNDPIELAERLQGITNIPASVPDQTDYQVGDTKQFWVTNVDTNENFSIIAELGYETDHVYFWIEQGVKYRPGDLSRLVETFENEIYPTNREFFGPEWTPGIDENEHLFLLYATGLGSNLAGYFSSADEVPPQAHDYSNAHEMFMLNADTIELDEKFTYGVLAHEFQHMIHWYRDRNESSWLNEGFSELAAFLNGYYESGFDYLAMLEPDLQLNDWPNDSSATTPHYGSSFLFVTYFLDRFGEDATKAVVADPANGMSSIDFVLNEINALDPFTNEPITADDVFADWVVTNFLMDEKANDGRYTYTIYDSPPQPGITESVNSCTTGWLERDVNQYGVDYISINCDQDFILTFEGETEVGVLPENPYSGDYAVWSNKGDESDMTLTRDFDFTNVSGPIEFEFRTWYDLETDYDYLYLEVSDDGLNWDILTTPSCTSEDPSGNSFGCGYNDVTNGWVKEVVDLSDYAGKEIQLRFEYITDAAVNGEGFLLDDVSVPAIDYFSDFETDLGGWIPDGWVRIQNRLPQTFELSLIETNGSENNVIRLPLDATQTIQLQVNGAELDEVVLTVSGSTRFTRQNAFYRIYIQPAQ